MKSSSFLVLLVGLLLTAELSQANAASSQKRDTNDKQLVAQESNEIEQRISISEPYKLLLETTTKFALAQTKVTKVVNLDTAVRILGDLGSIALRPTVLVKLVRALASAFAVLFTTTFFFPSTYYFMEAVWKNPIDTLSLDKLASNADEALSRMGLRDTRCREQSICHMGEILRCSFPQTSDALIKFGSENLSNAAIKEHPYPKAFILGFVDRNCGQLSDEVRASQSASCLSNFFNSVLLNPRARGRDRRSS